MVLDAEFDIWHAFHQSPIELLRQQVQKVNQRRGLNIMKFPPNFFYDEDRMACFLYDIHRLPIPQVLTRLIEEGATIPTTVDS